MGRASEWWDRHQVPLYLVAMGLGGLVGALVPATAPVLTAGITPLLGLLLFATFLGVPLIELGQALRDLRFLVTLLVVNFAVAPVLAFALSRFVADDAGLLLGVLLVLLTPCVDYVIVFTGLADGARERLLAAAPLLMVLQLVLLPGYLLLFAGADAAGAIEQGPFAEALLLLIVLPLGAAALVQVVARRRRTVRAGIAAREGTADGDSIADRTGTARRAPRAIETAGARAMAPLMMAVLAAVVGSQIAAVGAEAWALARLVPLYAVFFVLMVLTGRLAGRLTRLDERAVRAAQLSGATRNSLVVLPLALALPPALSLAPLAVVTQTLVELLALLVFVAIARRRSS